MSQMAWTQTGYAQQIRFGAGALDEVAGLVRDAGGRRIFLATTAGRLASPDGERLTKVLGRELASTFAGVQSHVPAPVVQAAVQQARRDGVDAVVSFGGGSCADLAKAVCYFTEREAGTPGATWLDRPALPHAAVLPAVVDEPGDVGARGAMLAGAALGGRALQNAAMGVHHGLAQLVGGRTGIAHGLANAVILPHAIRFNLDAVPDDLRRIGESLGDPDDAAGAVDRL